MTSAEVADPQDWRRVRSVTGLLRAFNDADVLEAADVHVANRLAALTSETDESVLLATCLLYTSPSPRDRS